MMCQQCSIMLDDSNTGMVWYFDLIGETIGICQACEEVERQALDTWLTQEEMITINQAN